MTCFGYKCCTAIKYLAILYCNGTCKREKITALLVVVESTTK
jgi:hypothetical protein